MTNPALHPDAIAAKYETLKALRDCPNIRHEALTDWQVSVASDGALLVSARLRGPDPAAALIQLAAWQASSLAHRAAPGSGHQVPATACVWRTAGVWVEVWHPDRVPTPVPAARVPSARAVPSPAVMPPRRFLGARLPYSRRRKETKPA